MPPPHPHDTANSVPLLVVTPSFAHWLDNSHPFLGQLLSRLYPTVPKSNTLYAVAAVIDRLPSSCAELEVSKLVNKGRDPVDGLDFEGLSLLVAGKDDVQGKVAPQRRVGGPASEEPDLVIGIQEQAGAPQRVGSTYDIGLRLANTVFINGKESTLFGVSGSYDEDTNAYTLNKKVDLTSCVVTFASTAVQPQVVLPLHPISQRRKVVSSMGNILRQLAKSSDPVSSEPMPASTELEKELPRYIAENKILDQKVAVWALVEKPDVDITGPSSTLHDRVVTSLRQGGKLHRVTSGGGGWGKKQGLLALDPEVNFTGSAQRTEFAGLEELFNPGPDAPLEMASFLTQGMVGDDLSLLSQVATAGDFIQFFVGIELAPHNITSGVHQHGSISCHFGVVSDTEELDARGTSGEMPVLVHVPNTFGALSEKAIAYSQPLGPGGMGSQTSTKLDIPGCRLVLSPV